MRGSRIDVTALQGLLDELDEAIERLRADVEPDQYGQAIKTWTDLSAPRAQGNVLEAGAAETTYHR